VSGPEAPGAGGGRARLADPQRLLRFGLVGLSGVAVNTFFLWSFTELGHLHYLISSPLAVELSILSNFTLNDLWTFRDRRGRLGLEARLGRFHLTAAGGFVINYALLWSLTEFRGVHYLLSNLVGILGGFVWNYCVNVLWTWRTPPPPAG
jgi:dolichol-phosphate mannosyltransferase